MNIFKDDVMLPGQSIEHKIFADECQFNGKENNQIVSFVDFLLKEFS